MTGAARRAVPVFLYNQLDTCQPSSQRRLYLAGVSDYFAVFFPPRLRKAEAVIATSSP